MSLRGCRLFGLLLVFWALLLATDAARSDGGAQAAHDDTWFSIYAGDSRIGASHLWSHPDTYEGRSVVLENSDTNTSLVAFGVAIGQKVTGQTWADLSTGRPLYETISITSGGASTNVAARYFSDHIEATLTSGGSVTHKSVPIPSGVTLTSSDIEHGRLSESILQRGQVFSESAFDPLSLRIETYTITVLDVNRSLNDPVEGQMTGVSECRADGPTGSLTVYLDSKGQALRIDMAAGLTMRREQSEPSATTGGAYTPPTDFAVATSLAQSGTTITRPRECRYLKLELTTPDRATRIVEVRTTDPGTQFSTTDSVRGDLLMQPYLADTAYLSLDDSDLQARAKSIGLSTTNLYDLVVRTRDWVYQNMTAAASLGLPRSAASILHDPRGVCRDYAILYTALARAEGIPTRICVGLVAFGGRFYYHAWAESYVGGTSGWIPVDPTMESRTVDATHVVITRGGPDAIFDVASQIGRIQARVIEASY